MNKKNLFLLLLLPFITCSCYQNYYHSNLGDLDPLYKKKGIKMAKLKEHGDKYHRRGNSLVDISKIGPNPDESFEEYEQRLYNTLATQESDIQEISYLIEHKRENFSNLEDQYAKLEGQNNNLRIAFADLKDAFKGKINQRSNLFEPYIVKKGDTLQGISHKFYDSYSGWLAIYRFNTGVLKDGPNNIEIGDALLIPNIDHINMHEMGTQLSSN